ncbi:unnamed protein product [Cylindrotheca closterium]|uniref:Uncharacterized protein n=1 Tax=Cylindrotheca closterium TaxID=2856 RepID=A0AAD2FHJ3_9STRA|nr:unnamed protein product [Cylindrotheca closterium]
MNQLCSSMIVDGIPPLQNQKTSQIVVTYENSESASVVGILEVSADMGATGVNAGANGIVSDSAVPSPGRRRRSIFCSYWKNDNQNTKENNAPHQSRTVQRSESPRCVLRHPYVQVYAMSEKHNKNSCSSNKKEDKTETASRPYDSRPLLLASMWKSLPAIFLEERSKALSRPIKSEPILGSNKLKPTLRKGRFSGGLAPQDERCRTGTSVTFQPLIKIHPFEPPMDRWAESGWSKQFGS